VVEGGGGLGGGGHLGSRWEMRNSLG
jgi:hypothetical protein